MSLSDIWGATDKELDSDEIIVPQDPAEAYKAGMRWGVERNLKIVQKWAESLPDSSSALEVAKSLSITLGDFSSILNGKIDFWADINSPHRSDELARVARICQKGRKIYANE